ncbi:MAG TPA: type IV pilus secretin PilQ [Candidatus Sulfotelmatobacter sp.]|nr:type IV pilus secretin PilQ [Candidatus Sulfotelmatobacter sp.]
MRKQQVTIFVSILLLVVAAAAQTPSQLDRVNVVRGTDDIRVEMRASGTVTPKLSTLDSPARVVVDLPETVMATRQTRIAVGAAGVKGVRIGMDGQTHPTTRIVVDLDQACAYELTPGAAGKMVLTLHANAVAKAASETQSGTKTVAASSPVPAGKPMSPFSPRVMDAQSAPKAETTPATKPTAKDSASPSDFVFVEPSYQAKNQVATPAAGDVNKDVKNDGAADDPTVRAQEAAARFSDKTAAELLPVSVHAAEGQSQSQAPTITPAVNLAAEQKAQAGQQPASVGPKYTGEPISVNLKDVDLKDFFRLIHEISGLNVVLDPNVHGTLTVVLDDVPWDQALDIVLKNNDLARELEGNVLRIATVETLKHEADGRRAQIESEALAVEKVQVTRFLSYAQAKAVVVTVKKFLSQRGDVVADDRTNAVIINDIPKVIPVIDRLLTQLDRKTQEVEIEARVVAATRQFARDIGTQFGFAWGNGHTGIGGNQAAGSSPTTVNGLTPGYITTAGTGSSTGATIPLFSNLGSTAPSSGLSFVNASNNVRIDAILSLAESRGLLKVLSRPRVVTQNNIQALVKQGVRVPIVTQAQLGGPPTVTYVDAFLRLTVTPQITSENTIFLNVDVENTTPNFGQEVQGNPELITQQATTQVLVTDGGTVVIGGVIQTQNSINISQVPLLGNLPFLGNLFKHTQVTTSNQELIFFITPRIIQT